MWQDLHIIHLYISDFRMSIVNSYYGGIDMKYLRVAGCGLLLSFGVFSYADMPSALASEKLINTVQEETVFTKGFSAEQSAELDKELEALVGEGPLQVPGLATIVYRDGKEVYRKSIGRSYIDTENPQNDKQITTDTRFRIASASKMFVAFTIMQLVEQGKINLDDDCSKYLGFKLRHPEYPNTPITVRMLANHTSGIRDGEVYSIPVGVSVREFFYPEGKFWENGNHFSKAGQFPGEYFRYCNLNYGLLGTIIESVTGERFDLYQKEHILKQLDISADYLVSNFTDEEFAKLGTIYRKVDKNGVWDENGLWYPQIDDYRGIRPEIDTANLQNPYDMKFDKVNDFKDYIPGINATPFSPQGGLRISAEELTHVLEMLMNNGIYRGNQVLSEESVSEMLKSQWLYDEKLKNGNTENGFFQSYGLGLYHIYGDRPDSRICKDKDVNLTGHVGEAYGLMSGLFFQPDAKNGFVYIMNGEAVSEDDDPRSIGSNGSFFIWEEKIMEPICRLAMDGN